MDKEFNEVREAAYAGDLPGFKSLLNEKPYLLRQVSQDKKDSPNLIQFIIVEGGLGKIPQAKDFLQFLIDQGSSTEKQLVAAASVNARELVDVLIASGISLDDGAPWTAIEESLYWGHRAMADHLINFHGAEVKTLCGAAMLGDLIKLASFFNDDQQLEASVLPISNPWGVIQGSTEEDALSQAFLMALSFKEYAAASYLLERGVKINSRVVAYHVDCTPLNQAVYMNDCEMVDWLIDRGAKNPQNGEGADIFAMAKHHGFIELEEHLKRRLSS